MSQTQGACSEGSLEIDWSARHRAEAHVRSASGLALLGSRMSGDGRTRASNAGKAEVELPSRRIDVFEATVVVMSKWAW